MVEKRHELESLHERMNGLIFDVEYSVDAVKSLRNSDEHFNVNKNYETFFFNLKKMNNIFIYLEYCNIFRKIGLY